jgi:hypothetical protein
MKKRSEAIAKCPLCGSDILKTPYEHYCTGHCGMDFRIFGRMLDDEVLKKLLKGELVTVEVNDTQQFSSDIQLLNPDTVPYVGDDGSEHWRLNYMTVRRNSHDNRED